MSDIKLFQSKDNVVIELPAQSASIEKSLQQQLEANLDAYLGVRFLASEYATGKVHGGRIDTLGIDENGCPVIIEYKRSLNENVMNQGLFYLDWLMDHKAEFELLVLKQLDKEASESIEWSSPRLLCIAGDFTKYDEHAVQQINRNIELIRYRRYGDNLLLLELVNATTATENAEHKIKTSNRGKGHEKTGRESLERFPQKLKDLFESLRAFVTALGDDVQEKTLKNYIAFKRFKNFACIDPHPSQGKLLVFTKVNPDSIKLEEGFTRDVRGIGHWGTGDLEVTIQSMDDLEKAKPLLIKSYEVS